MGSEEYAPSNRTSYGEDKEEDEKMSNSEQDYNNNISNNNGFRDYAFEDKIHHKSSLKKKLAQAKRLLVNKASKEYSQVHEQQDQKSVPKMLVSVSKIHDIKGIRISESFYFMISLLLNKLKTASKANIKIFFLV